MILELLREKGLETIGRFYSQYRGNVIDNNDPQNLNRLLIRVPEVMSDNRWAFPKGQRGAIGSGSKDITPKVGDIVFVEFECGDPLFPLWSSSGWAISETPEQLKGNNIAGICTQKGNYITLNDDDDILTVNIPTDEGNQKIIITKNNITINADNGNVNINGENIILNNGNIGTTKTDVLVTKLNAIENDINILKGLLLSAPGVTIPGDGGTAGFSSFASYAANVIIPTTMSEIEHNTVKQ